MTDRSEQEFQELVAHLVAHANKALTTSNEAPPMSLALTTSGDVEIGVGVADPESLQDVVNAMQQALSDRAVSKEITAACIAFSNNGEGHINAFLENDENYCAKAVLPVEGDGSGRSINLANIAVEDGSIFVFPIVGES